MNDIWNIITQVFSKLSDVDAWQALADMGLFPDSIEYDHSSLSDMEKFLKSGQSYAQMNDAVDDANFNNPALMGSPNGYFANLGNKWSGKGLTNAERIQNQFNSEQAEIARNFSAAMANTQYQRGVVDMQKAGINPALAMTSGANPAPTGQAVSASSAGPSPTMSFAEMMSMLMLPFQLKNLNAETKNVEVRTQGEALKNQYQNLVNGYYPSLTQTTIDQMVADIAGTYQNIDLSKAQQALVEVQKVIADAEAGKAKDLVQARLDLMDAQTKAAKNAAIASAAAAFIDQISGRYMQQNGMLMTSSETLAVVEALAGYLGLGSDDESATGEVVSAVKNAAVKGGFRLVDDLKEQMVDRRKDRQQVIGKVKRGVGNFVQRAKTRFSRWISH